MLEESLRRFLQAQYNNVGNNRVMCGMVAGVVFILLGALPVIILNFLRGDSRWSRLATLPGLWLGLTILIASLNGICLGVYLFGDLRQLRTFELSRPPISKPQPLPAFVKPIVPRPLSTSNSILPIQSSDFRLQRAQSRGRTLSTSSGGSGRTGISTQSEGLTTSDSDDGIEISQPYDDEDTIDGPATCTLYYAAPDAVPERSPIDDNGPISPSQTSFLSTASFIQPFEIHDDDDLESGVHPPSHQPVHSFDFDSLPRRPKSRSPPRTVYQPTLRELTMPQRLPSPPPAAKPAGFLARFQERCSVARWRLQPGYLETSDSSSRSIPPHPSSPYWSSHPGPQTPQAAFSRPSNGRSLSVTSGPYRDNFDPTQSPNPALSIPSRTYRPSSDSKLSETTKGNGKTRSDSMDVKDNQGTKEESVWKRFKKVKEVPAFAVPLTRVLSPVVVRGQWEIVVRSAVIAFLISWVVLGVILAAPVVSK